MQYVYSYLITGLWIVWVGYWQIMARRAKQTKRIESPASRASHFVPLLVGIVLIAWPDKDADGFFAQTWPQNRDGFWIGVAILLFGFFISVWARRVLGRNWSNAVTVKQEHELIKTGPYARIRHPIYTGLILGFLGTAVALAEWRGFLAVLLIYVSFFIKLRIEEVWMTQVFGAQYDEYRQHTGMLIPRLV